MGDEKNGGNYTMRRFTICILPTMSAEVKYRMLWAEYFASVGETSWAYTPSIGKSEMRRPFGKTTSKCRWKNNIKIYN
jgi:hypothetical protein